MISQNFPSLHHGFAGGGGGRSHCPPPNPTSHYATAYPGGSGENVFGSFTENILIENLSEIYYFWSTHSLVFDYLYLTVKKIRYSYVWSTPVGSDHVMSMGY